MPAAPHRPPASAGVLTPSSSPRSAERVLLLSLAVTFALKLVAAALFPLTGDEAYFVQWGRTLAGSYYDHGPVTGWMLWLFLQVGDHPAWLRLPAILAPIGVAWMVWRAWRKEDPERAALAASLVAWALPSVISVLVTTDTPLLFLSTASAVMAARAHRSDRAWEYLAAGALLGLAFLAKYFAVLLGVGLAVWWLLVCRPRRWRAVLLLLAGAAPFIGQHLYWNYHHAWTNVMFNVFTRQEGLKLSPASPLLFLLMAGWLFGPVLLALRRLDKDRWLTVNRLMRSSSLGMFVIPFLTAHGVLFAVSVVRPVGLHWLLSFFPLGFAAVMLALPTAALRRLLRPVALFSLLHLGIALLVLLLPVEKAQGHRSYSSIVMGLYPEETLAVLAPLRDKAVVATPSYSRSALLEYHLGEDVPVLGPGSFHGRQDDLRTDWRTHAGRNVLFITAKEDELERARGWFSSSTVHRVELRGATLLVLQGRGFDYEAYRQDVLKPVSDRYYEMPGFLRAFSSGSFFRERYGFE